MAATVEARIHHGAAPGLGTDVTNQTIRFKRADDDVQDSVAPVPVPDAGFAYSWRKSLRLVIVTAPDNRVENLRFFTDGASLGVGREVFFARSSSYVQATAGDEGGAIGSTNVDSLTSSSPEVLQAGTLASSGDIFPTAGTGQDFVMLQLRNATAALAGDAAAAKTLFYRYDET